MSFKNQRWWLAAPAIIMALVLSACATASEAAGSLAPANVVKTIGTGGGTAWNPGHTVGVRIPKGGVKKPTKIAYQKPAALPAEAPLAAAFDVVVPPVDIHPDQRVTKADIVFKIPGYVPRNPTNAKGKRQRSIKNAAIEAYNNHAGIWVPLPTTVDHGLLVAHAPHFSLYRAVWEKVGAVTLNLDGQQLKLSLTALDNPVTLMVNTFHAVAHTFTMNFFGQLDPEKFECEPRDEDYQVEIEGDTSKSDACVKKEGQETTVLIKNGWAVPLRYWSDADLAKVHPRIITGEADVASLIKNFYGALTGTTYSSGLDVAGFDIHDGAPDEFTITGRLTLGGSVADLALSLLTVIFPVKTGVPGFRSVLTKVFDRTIGEYRLGTQAINPQRTVAILKEVAAGESPTVFAQAATALDVVNCLATVGQKVAHMKDLAAAIGDSVRLCFSSAMLKKLGVEEFKPSIAELLKSLAKETKTIPAVAQLIGIGAAAGLTGKDPTKLTITVTKMDDAWLRNSQWTYGCAGTDDSLTVEENRTGTWKAHELDAHGKVVKSWRATFKVKKIKGKLALVITSGSTPTNNGVGSTLYLKHVTYPHGDEILLYPTAKMQYAIWVFSRGSVPSYC